MAKTKKIRTGTAAPGSRRPVTIGLLVALVVALLGVVLTMRSKPTDAPPPSVPPTAGPTARAAVYMPAEFDRQDALLLGGTQLVSLFPETLAQIVRALADEGTLHILAGSPDDHARIDSLAQANGANVTVLDLPVRTMWVRDFGPVTVSDVRGRRHLVDFHYRERRGNQTDDDVPGHVGKALDLAVTESPLLVEGGDFLTNGRGFCLLSTRVVNRNAHYLELTPEETINNLAALLGFESLSLAQPLIGESTGHVDMFAAFLGVDLVVVGQYSAQDDAENATRLDEVAQELATRQTLAGPLRVERIPMPDHNDGVWRTYTNIALANEVVLVPVYPDYCPELDKVALETYRRLLPGRRIVGIDAGRLIRMNGALRCITMNMPQAAMLSLID